MSYQTEVAADSPFVYYPDASAAPWADDIGALDMTITGATANQTGPLTSGDTKAFSFDGTDDSGQVALDLSDTAIITVEFWLWWDSYANNDDLAMEFTSNTNSVDGGFFVNPNSSSGGGGSFEFAMGTSISNRLYTRPSAAAWHHYAWVLDRTPNPDTVTAYLDGSAWTPDSSPNSGNGSNFANSTLNAMCRNAASLFGAGDMAHLAIYKSALSAGRFAAHYAAASEVAGTKFQVVRSALRF